MPGFLLVQRWMAAAVAYGGHPSPAGRTAARNRGRRPAQNEGGRPGKMDPGRADPINSKSLSADHCSRRAVPATA